MVNFVYKFQIFGKGTKREDMDGGDRGWGGRGPGGHPGGGPIAVSYTHLLSSSIPPVVWLSMKR